MNRSALVSGAAAATLAVAACGRPAQRPPLPGSSSPPGVGRPITTTGRPPARQSNRVVSRSVPPPPLAKSEPVAPARGLGGADRTAKRFFISYIGYLYARLHGRAVADVDPQLRALLQDDRALGTPAERAARPAILHITLAPAGPPVSAIATATVVADGQRHRLTATLEPRARGWIVVAVDA